MERMVVLSHARFAQDAETRRIFGMGDDTASRSGLGAILCVLAALREAKTNVEEDCFVSRPLRSRRRARGGFFWRAVRLGIGILAVEPYQGRESPDHLDSGVLANLVIRRDDGNSAFQSGGDDEPVGGIVVDAG